METEMFEDLISQGISLMSCENYAAAKECFEKAAHINPKSKDLYKHLGNANANLGMYDEALEAFQKILILSANDGETFFSMGNVYVLQNKKLKAIEYYNKAEESGYATSQMYQIMASIFFEVDDVAQALRNISRAIHLAPFDGTLRLFKARIYLAYNRYDEALETLDEMEKILPDAYEAYDMKAQIFCGLTRYEEALEISKKARERFPEDSNIAAMRLKVLVAAEKNQEARLLLAEMKNKGMYEAVIKDAVIQESILDIKEQQIDRAYEALLQANNILAADSDILYLILDLCGKTGMYEKVLVHSEELMKIECSDFYQATAMYFHANALEETGQKEKAKEEYKSLTSKLRKFTINNPSFYEGYLYRLLSHAKIGEYEQALKLTDYVENLYPDRADAHAFRYFIYKEMGNEELADKEKGLASKLNPNLMM